MRIRALVPILFALVFACKEREKAAAPAAAPEKAPPVKTSAAPLTRSDWNRIAAELYLPLFWSADQNENATPDAEELAVLWGMSDGERSLWIDAKGQPTARLMKALSEIVRVSEKGHDETGLDAKEKVRRKTVLKELSQGRITLLRHDFSKASAQDRAIVENVLAAARQIEALHLRQRGAYELLPALEKSEHAASRTLFYRNQGPWCVAPETENDERCSALPDRPQKTSGMYPKEVQKKGFCETLLEGEKTKALMLDHFSVIEKTPEGLVSTPYPEAYPDEMETISAHLKKAAAAITEGEAPFKAYLLATAQAFVDNNWDPANEAWSKMNVHNSKWYLRIGPDEVYFEPCSQKAGFHVSFGVIDQGSLEWQKKLDPVKGEMEQALAKLAGPPYKAREVDFHLPDFFGVVLNAGDSRSPHGATIGQSLPNWGPVANEGRGRTVAMTNLYTDPDSQRDARARAESLLCPNAMKRYSPDPGPQIMSTVLHEAAHNLGPAHEYKVAGKVDDEVFGGPLASTLEELKAQTAALYFTDWLAAKEIISAEDAVVAHVRDLLWSFGHISRGMYSQTGKPKPYSQLAAIQLRFLLAEGAVTWKADATAANGQDKGCFDVVEASLPPAIEKLMARVAKIKGRGDKSDAEALVREFVDKDDTGKQLMGVIRERVLRTPKASFVYSVRL